MDLLHVAILAVIQGLCEMLPVSSSAHVIAASKILGLDPTTPQMTLLLVMLHTGTMGAVLVYFWKDWKRDFFSSGAKSLHFAKQVVIATAVTGVVGLALILFIEKVALSHIPHAEVELLFGNLRMIGIALASVGLLILFASTRENNPVRRRELGPRESFWIGLVQGICIPFRGFSRSGATISTGLITGLAKYRAEEFSFALVIVLTPPALARMVHRLLKSHAASGADTADLWAAFAPSLAGMCLSFAAGMLALRWLSNWLAKGKWKYFGYYCLFAAAGLWTLHYVLEG